MDSGIFAKEQFSRWFNRAEKRRNEREEIRRHVLKELNRALTELSCDYEWDDLYIFGSLISEGKFHPGSDVDIGVTGLNKFDHFAFTGDLSLLLERHTDIVRLEDCHFRDSIVAKGLKWKKIR